ncbi:MAG TPA: chemotaxis protein CheB [Cytophagaceae bacterium]|jgi:chemotaxis response regulator CheB|nr:chemotaxis protein CheB [Cytophagaceae bacterium]
MRDKDFFVVGVGASAGGTAPLFDFFSNIPANPGVAFVIVRHLNRNYKSQMKALLSKHTYLPIYTIAGGEAINPDCIYLMPENTNVQIKDYHFFLEIRKADEIINYAIDDFFISLASDCKEKAIGIILSGMGTDGTKGATAIEQGGGIVMVQNPGSSEYNGMTNSAIYNDHPDYILYPQEMGKNLLEYINSKHKVG